MSCRPIPLSFPGYVSIQCLHWSLAKLQFYFPDAVQRPDEETTHRVQRQDEDHGCDRRARSEEERGAEESSSTGQQGKPQRQCLDDV